MVVVAMRGELGHSMGVRNIFCMRILGTRGELGVRLRFLLIVLRDVVIDDEFAKICLLFFLFDADVDGGLPRLCSPQGPYLALTSVNERSQK